jgi:hypothetical protein
MKDASDSQHILQHLVEDEVVLETMNAPRADAS